ncbi:MAG: riboflavin kinase [Rhodospirillales bacterium]
MLLTRFPNLPQGLKNPVFAVGDFDGLHIGHRKMIFIAQTRGAAFVAVHYPSTVTAGRLSRTADLLRLLKALGAAGVCLVRPVTPVQAVMDKLRDFGVPDIFACDEKQAAMTRAAVRAGDIMLAKRLIGFAHELTGWVREGDKRGRSIGFPTANVMLGPLAAPKYGVYAVRVWIEGRKEGPWLGAANIGVRPTFGGGREPVMEAHLFDFNENIYGARIRVRLETMLRGEKRFDGAEALKAQIARDCQEARWLLGRADTDEPKGPFNQ